MVKQKYAETAFDGEGARRAGGRFNSPGRPVVYASASLALAELELLVNLPGARLPASYVAFSAQFDDALLETLAPDALPDGWRADPAPGAVKRVGDRWLREQRSLALQVPSAVVPAETNYLLNPEHPGFDTVQISAPFDPDIDPRLT